MYSGIDYQMIPFSSYNECPHRRYSSHLRILPDTENALIFQKNEINYNIHFHYERQVKAGD
jgi:hypothetical protein